MVNSFGGKVVYTKDQTYSSSSIINKTDLVFDSNQRKFIDKIKKKHGYNKISLILKKFKKLKVMVIGELIIDRYCFGNVIGKSGKEPHLVMQQNEIEHYLGGSAAIANHLSSFVNKIEILSPFGFEKFNKNLIENTFGKNIKTHFIKPDKNYKTIIKTRFVDQISGYKLFGSYILPSNHNLDFISKVKKIIKNQKNKIDYFLVCDYGHNFIDNQIANQLNSSKKIFF